MNEFTKDRPTAEQLVEKLDNELDITICSDVVHGLDYEYKQLQQKNQELKKQLEEVEFIVGLRQKRNLISKFDKEYDEEDKKKNPNRDYAGIMPDAEEIYRRYYTMKNQQKEFIEYLQNNIESLEFCDNEFILSNHKKEIKAYKEILSKYKKITKYKEIIGGKE